jgi:hypothetical protein
MTRIVLHIDKLVLRGTDPNDVAELTAALRQQLQSQFATTGGSEKLEGSSRHKLNLGSTRVEQPGAAALGQAVGQHIAKGLAP